MGTNENSQEMNEAREWDLPQEGFQLIDHPWLWSVCVCSSRRRRMIIRIEYLKLKQAPDQGYKPIIGSSFCQDRS